MVSGPLVGSFVTYIYVLHTAKMSKSILCVDKEKDSRYLNGSYS